MNMFALLVGGAMFLLFNCAHSTEPWYCPIPDSTEPRYCHIPGFSVIGYEEFADLCVTSGTLKCTMLIPKDACSPNKGEITCTFDSEAKLEVQKCDVFLPVCKPRNNDDKVECTYRTESFLIGKHYELYGRGIVLDGQTDVTSPVKNRCKLGPGAHEDKSISCTSIDPECWEDLKKILDKGIASNEKNIGHLTTGEKEVDEDEDEDEIYKHIVDMEGNPGTGYIPSAGSGVSIGLGIDLLHQDRAGLEAKGIPDSIITKLEPYFGKNKTQVEAEGLKAEDLKLNETELRTLNEPFIEEVRKIAEEYGSKMSDKGKAVLASLRHWAGRLGNTANAGKLAREQEDGSIINYVWNAIKDKDATDEELLKALNDTFATYDCTTPLNRRTIEREIEYLSNC